MRLEKLHLVNFKNYAEVVLDFHENVVCFLGKNGSGKTNLLEAIHYLSFTRGGIQGTDETNVRRGEDHFSISGRFVKDGRRFEISCTYSPDGKKKVSENGKDYGRFSSHIGKYPLVLVAPHDIELIWNGSEIRRKFFDTLFSQIDRQYLEHLISYQSHLRQRNSLLKIFAERGSTDPDLISAYDDKLVESGNILFQKRKEFASSYQPILKDRYSFLAGKSTDVAGLEYQSDLLNADFRSELTARLHKDVLIGRTTLGVHRDDYLFTLDGYELKKFGSQGQQKSFLIALKLAEYNSLQEKTGTNPLLLLDDIFDKLDDERIHHLLRLMTEGQFGQIFITDARPSRTLELLKEARVKSQTFAMEENEAARGER
jgi:DNA replication and repair protein RecF